MNIREPSVILEKTKSSINFNCVMGDSVCVSLSGAEEREAPPPPPTQCLDHIQLCHIQNNLFIKINTLI